MIQADGRIVPVILSGGAGAGLWPMSRESSPKQLLSLLGQHTLVQRTALRVADPLVFANPMVIANAEHRFELSAQLQSAGVTDALIALEPFGRGTAPAVTIAAVLATRADHDAVMLLMPADQRVDDDAAFRSSVLSGLSSARHQHFVQFHAHETGWAGPDGNGSVVQKGKRAERNGIFLLPAQLFLEELGRRVPQMLLACRGAIAGAARDLDFLRLEEAAFRSCPSMSINDLLADMADRTSTVAASFDCTHIGSWSSLRQLADKDHAGNVAIGDVLLDEASELSLQKHFHRSEHWVVVGSTAIVTRDDEEMLLHENESVFVPLGCIHRIENPGKIPLHLIEVQSGTYLGEDDIVRVQDVYHRA